MTGALNSQLTDVLANGAAFESSKLTGEMNWMHTYTHRNFSYGQVLGESFSQHLDRALEPLRSMLVS